MAGESLIRSLRQTLGMSHDGSRSHLEDLVVISGLSGAGKSSAMNVFEDAGYFCVDNLPAEMIRSLAELFRHPGSKVERAAVVCDSRGGEYLEALAGGGVVVGRPRLPQPAAHQWAVALGQVVEHVSLFVAHTALNRRIGPEDVADGLPKCLGAVDDHQHALVDVEAALDQVGQQRGRHRRVFG